MEGTPAVYLGRIIEKKHFRAFIYGPNGERKLVESWDEFEANMQSGIWFATVEDAEASKAIVEEVEPVEVVKKPRKKPVPKAKSVEVEPVDELEEVLPADGSVIEVKDDFLPTGNE